MTSAPISMKAIVVASIYARYSSDRQRDASIEDQIRLCKEMIARMGWVVGPIYIDKQVSGSVVSREGFQHLRRDVRRGLFQVVVAESFHRLMRDTEASANFRKPCMFAGVAIQTCSYGPGNKLVMGVKAVMDEVFLDDLADKTRRGLRGRIEAGASAGGISYGCDVAVTAEGEDKGQRCVNVAFVRLHGGVERGASWRKRASASARSATSSRSPPTAAARPRCSRR